MVAPLAPVLLRPESYEYLTATNYTFQWEYRHPQRLAQDNVTIGRRLIPAGTWEYATTAAGTTWNGTENSIACTDPEITIGTIGTANNRYQYKLRTRCTDTSWSPYTPEVIGYVVGTPTVTINTINTDTTSPMVTWIAAHPQGVLGMAYRVAVIDRAAVAAVYGIGVASDPDDQMANAFNGAWDKYIVDKTDWISDYDAYSHQVYYDMTPGFTFDVVIEVQFEGGQIASDAEDVTPSVDLPSTPIMSITPDDDTDTMNIFVSATGNLIPVNGSDFEEEIEDDPSLSVWGVTQLAAGTFVRESTDSIPSLQGLWAGRYYPKSRTYAQIDAAYTTYANWTASEATYHAAIAPVNPSWVDEITLQLDEDIGIIATHDYILMFAWRPGLPGAGTTLPVPTLNCYDEDNALIGTATGSSQTVPLETNGWEWCKYLYTSFPVGTTKVNPVLTFGGIADTYEDREWIDSVAFAVSTADIWETAGFSSDLGIVIERTFDDGLTWESVPGYSREFPGDIGHRLGMTTTEADRTARVGYTGDVTYRSYLTGYNASREPIMSLPVVITLTAPLRGNGWWLRDLYDPDNDVQLRQIDFNSSFGLEPDVLKPAGRSDPVAVHRVEPIDEQFQLHMWTETSDEYDKVLRILSSRKTFYVQSNISLGWYLQVAGGISQNFLATPTQRSGAAFKRQHEWTADVVKVEPPKLQARSDYNNVPGLSYVDVT